MLTNLTSRIRKSPAFRTALTSYFQIGSVAIAGLIAVPIALSFLDAQEFGLWIFTKQGLGYLLLLDFGVGATVGRLMGGAFAGNGQADRCFVTLSTIMLLQALIIVVVGTLLLPSLLEWFQIPLRLRDAAEQIWTISLWGSATKHATRVIDGTLFAQNRVYWSNISGGIGAWMELTIFLILLYFGWGVESYSWAYITSILCSVLGIGIAFYAGPWRPQLRARNFDISMLKELFSFSLKLFVLGAVAQVVFLSQSLIATKLFGLTAAGSYNVCMRLLQLGRQVIARLHDAHIPGWQKLFLDGQMAELLGRWRYHFKFVVGSTLFGAITITCWNSLFVNHWASPALNIGPAFDFLSGAFLLANIWTGAMMAPLIFKMELKIRTYMALIQLVMTLLLCFSFSKYFGLKGVLLGALIANLITVFWFNSWKGAQILGEKWNQIWDRILRPNTALLAAMACCGIISLFGNFETSYSLTIWGFSAIAYILIHRDYLIEFVYKQSAS